MYEALLQFSFYEAISIQIIIKIHLELYMIDMDNTTQWKNMDFKKKKNWPKIMRKSTNVDSKVFCIRNTAVYFPFGMH